MPCRIDKTHLVVGSATLGKDSLRQAATEATGRGQPGTKIRRDDVSMLEDLYTQVRNSAPVGAIIPANWFEHFPRNPT